MQAYTYVLQKKMLMLNWGYAQKYLHLSRMHKLKLKLLLIHKLSMHDHNILLENNDWIHTCKEQNRYIRKLILYVFLQNIIYHTQTSHMHENINKLHYAYTVSNYTYTQHLSFLMVILRSAPQIKLWGEGDHKLIRRNSTPQNSRKLTQSLYMSRMSQQATNSSSSQRYKEKLLALENDPDVEMFVTQKRSSSFSQVTASQKKAKGKTNSGLKRPSFWLGYQAMNWTNKGKGLPMDSHVPVATLVKNGMREKEARECQSVVFSFHFVIQEEWPNSRENGKEGQHFNLTQIPSDVEVDKFGFSFDYQIAIIFEMGENEWEKDTVMPLVESRLKEMDIKLGDIIGKPIALMCYHKSTKWSGVIKLHLKTPEIDGVGLLQGLRPFILKLDDGKFKKGKICKTYDSLALNNLLSVKISSEGLASKE